MTQNDKRKQQQIVGHKLVRYSQFISLLSSHVSLLNLSTHELMLIFYVKVLVLCFLMKKEYTKYLIS